MSSQIWSIGLALGPSPLALQVSKAPVLTKDDIADVEAGFVADPFLLCQGSTVHMFFEVWNCGADKGEIGHAQSPDMVNWIYRGIVLREPWHLSYPHVFEHGGGIWMMPETIDGHGVRLYRADSFPDRWRYCGELVPRAMADPTPFEWQGSWYLFACSSFHRHDDLVLYTSKCLEDGWREHPASPLRTGDARRSRPAGRILNHDGRLLRWAQDCQPRYGTAVRAFEIVELSAARYRERELAESPVLACGEDAWRHGGMHHLDACRVSGAGSSRWMAAVDGFRVEHHERA